MAYETLTVDQKGGVAIVTFNRPDSLNALNSTLLKEFAQALESLAQSDSEARCLLLTGAGRGFSSGADLTESSGDMARPDRDLGKVLEERYHPILRTMDNYPLPIVSAVNGLAAGAGMSLALSADIVMAGKSAYFLQAFVNIGLVPDASSTFLLPRLIGRSRALAMMMLGERIPAETAEDWGLIHKACEDESLMDEALEVAERLAKGPTVALELIRKLGRSSLENTFEEQLELERSSQRTAGRTADFMEGVAAFMQKREANFQGK